MIIKRGWVTTKTRDGAKRFKIDGEIYRYCTRKWEGWFLFGFIPLYIKQISVGYK